MAEHFRVRNEHTGEIHSWCDREMAVVMDTITGEIRRFPQSVLPLEDAIKHTKNLRGWESRTVIVRLNCIVGFKVSEG